MVLPADMSVSVKFPVLWQKPITILGTKGLFHYTAYKSTTILEQDQDRNSRQELKQMQ